MSKLVFLVYVSFFCLSSANNNKSCEKCLELILLEFQPSLVLLQVLKESTNFVMPL